jgi:hypothetical protein
MKAVKQGSVPDVAPEPGEAPARETAPQLRAAVEEITQALDDRVPKDSESWWQYFFVLVEVGSEAVRALVLDVRAVEAQGGMLTRDGSRRRTPGGVFFKLAYDRLGRRGVCRVRRRAEHRVQMAGSEQPRPSPLAVEAPAVAETRREFPTAPAGSTAPTPALATAQAAAPAPAPAPPKSARRQELPAVEVIVRRRSSSS